MWYLTCTHNGVSHSNKKNEFLLFVTTRVDLEGIIPSETSQPEKDKYTMSHPRGVHASVIGRQDLELTLPENEIMF